MNGSGGFQMELIGIWCEIEAGRVTLHAIADLLGVSEAFAARALNGSVAVQVSELLAIRECLCPDCTLDYLVTGGEGRAC